jgi:GNAT superfamily N-acetyltransferase
MADYPEHLVHVRRLYDGTVATIRPVKPEDAALEQDFFQHLSQDSLYYRFMGHVRELPPGKAQYFTTIDYDRHMAFICTVQIEGNEAEIGGARYVVNPDGTSCEFAVEVNDAWQGRGVAGLLMAELIDAAKARGLKLMEGLVLASNHKMLKFARQLGFTLEHVPNDWEMIRAVLTL